MEKLMKLMEKKKQEGKQMDPMYKESKMSMLKALKDEMTGMMKSDLSPEKMKEVKVASNSTEGLAKGLDKAKELIGDPSGPEGASEEDASEEGESDMEESAESPEEEKAEGELSSEEIDQLQMLLTKLKKSQA